MTTDTGIVQWYYGNENKQSEERLIEWIKYRDIEMEIIETAYQQRKSEVFLDKYRIDFNKWIQYNRVDSTEESPVKRQTDCRREDCLREERFFSQSSLTSTSSYGSAHAWCPFLSAWHNTSAGKKALFDFSSAIDACADGILQEAARDPSDSQTEANWMVEQLLACKEKSRRETSRFCVHLYTRESFLYRILNTALRDGDHSKLDTLGPLCFLIRSYSHACKAFIGTVYRGVDLSPAMITSYKQAEGMWRTWPSFTSTSKNKKMAEIRGNTLFIITIANIQFSFPVRACDISDISQFPSEEEVLSPAGISFQIVRVVENPYQKNIIEIKI
jgi:hypothetical protein